jgi:hypothetical protein
MTNSKHVLSVGLAAAALVAVLPFFAGGLLLLQPGIAPLLAQLGFVPGTEPAWFDAAFGTVAIALATASFAVSWKQRSFLVAGLLTASGFMYMISALLATIFILGTAVPGPILGVISGLGILGLGAAKGIRTAKAEVMETRQYE